jgi:hypothetical protein
MFWYAATLLADLHRICFFIGATVIPIATSVLVRSSPEVSKLFTTRFTFKKDKVCKPTNRNSS